MFKDTSFIPDKERNILIDYMDYMERIFVTGVTNFQKLSVLALPTCST